MRDDDQRNQDDRLRARFAEQRRRLQLLEAELEQRPNHEDIHGLPSRAKIALAIHYLQQAVDALGWPAASKTEAAPVPWRNRLSTIRQ